MIKRSYSIVMVYFAQLFFGHFSTEVFSEVSSFGSRPVCGAKKSIISIWGRDLMMCICKFFTLFFFLTMRNMFGSEVREVHGGPQPL